MARPPTDPNPVASTGGAANLQGQAIFTGDWNALVADYLSQTDTNPQNILSPILFNTTQTFIPQSDVPAVVIKGWQNQAAAGHIVDFYNISNELSFYFSFEGAMHFRQSGASQPVFDAGILGQPAPTWKLYNDSSIYYALPGATNFDVRWLHIDNGVFQIYGNLFPTFPAILSFYGPDRDLRISQTNNSLVLTDGANTVLRDTLLDVTPVAVGGSLAVGTSTGYARGDHVHTALSGTLVLINADETQASATVPNADTNLKTYSLGTNNYSKIIVEAEGYASFVVTSTNQIANVKIKDAGTQKGQTMTVDAALGATSRIPFSIKASFVETTAQTLSVTIGAAAADANTTIFLNSMRVYGVI